MTDTNKKADFVSDPPKEEKKAADTPKEEKTPKVKGGAAGHHWDDEKGWVPNEANS